MEQLMIPSSIAKNLPAMVKNELVKLPPQKQEDFIEEYKRKAKFTDTAHIFWLLLGCHYAYLGKWGIQVLFWLTAGGVFIWWIVDLFRIPDMVRDFNKDIAIDVLRNLKMISD